MNNQKFEYEKLSQLEQETTRVRLTTFTALLSVSFILPGLALQADKIFLDQKFFGVNPSQFVFLLGFFFYCFAVFHYQWFHRYSHIFRRELRRIELTTLKIRVYRLRERPIWWKKFKPRFVCSLYLLGIIYGFITIGYVGIEFFLCTVLGIVILYGVCIFFCLKMSYCKKEEPYYKDDKNNINRSNSSQDSDIV